MPRCPDCHGMGYVLAYRARVIRVYCGCPAGIKAKETVKRSLRKHGS